MDDNEMKQLAAEICPSLDLTGCYKNIMPRITSEQLELFFAAVNDQPVWSTWAANMLVYAPALTDEHRAALVGRVTRSTDAEWVLRKAPDLTDDQRDVLVGRVTRSTDAAWVLVYAPALTDDDRAVLERVANQ